MERYRPAPYPEVATPLPVPTAITPAHELPFLIELPAQSEPFPQPVYETAFGAFTFEALAERTKRYAAFALRCTYQVNEADIEDGLQAGCLKLWQRLQEQPELLKDKSLAWVGKGVIYTALHATRGELSYRRHTVSDSEEASAARGKAFRAHSWESRQSDIRIDLQTAVKTVAEQILAERKGKRRDHNLWALYGLTMLQVTASETSRLFGVREQSMQKAYTRVREQLRHALPNYAPVEPAKPFVQRGPETLPKQDTQAIRKANGDVSQALYQRVKGWIETTGADTWKQDILALEGIRQKIPAQTQARTHNIPQWKMQRAYDRVHLLIGRERDPSIRIRRPEHRMQSVFTLTETTALAVEQLAFQFLHEPKSYEKLVALHTHIGNLAISTTAKHFNIPTSTLRYYVQQIGSQLGTPMRPAREIPGELAR